MSKLNQILILLIIPIIISCGVSDKDEITITTLLEEMVDRDAITQFPENGYKTLQASSYNRESVSPDKPGWFADSDGVYCIRTEENNGKKEWVLMEDEGPGVITKIWAVCFYYGLKNTTGANINFYLDGNPEPAISTNFFNLVKGNDFVKVPLADSSARAGNLYFPIPYAKSCKITMDNKVFYNIINYRKYPKGTKIKTFTMEDFRKSEKTIAKVSNLLMMKPSAEGVRVKESRVVKPNESVTFALPSGNNALRQFSIKISDTKDIAQALRSVVLTADFDDNTTVWAPVGDFFNNVGKIRSYDMWERSVSEDGTMTCRWVMPYKESAVFGVENFGNENVTVNMSVITNEMKWTDNSMHFYATWQMDNPTPTFPLYDWNFLEATGKGVVVGDQWTVLNPVQGWWGEGDEKIYVDEDFNRNFPSHFGTGTEDYYGWAGGVVPTPKDEFVKPFLGNVIVGENRSKGYNVCSRTRSLDAIPFNNKIKFDIESSCGRRSKSHFLQYAQTTFWYGKPGVKHNRNSLPEFASAKLPQIEDLEKLINDAKSKQYIVDGALEAEIYPVVSKSEGVKENFAKIPMWGEISSGDMKNLWFTKKGDFAELKITEQFEDSDILMCAALGRTCGDFDIYVNGIKKVSQNFRSNHEGMTNPYVNLGKCKPVNNAFTIKFIYKGADTKGNKLKSLGIDFFIIKNNFLKREG